MIRLAGLLLAALGVPFAAQAQHVGVPLVSTSALGVVSATYGYFQFVSATSSNIVATDSTKVAKAGDSMTGALSVSIASGQAVSGITSSGYGVYGQSASTYGVYGKTTLSTAGGVLGYTADGLVFGILGHSNAYSLYGNGQIYAAGNITTAANVYAVAYYHTSDQALKSNIETYSGGLATIEKLRGVRFDWRSNKTSSAGVIAQEVEKVLPSAVSTNLHGHKAVDYDQLIAPMIEAIKELKAANDNLEAANDTLARENRALRDDVRQIKAVLKLR